MNNLKYEYLIIVILSLISCSDELPSQSIDLNRFDLKGNVKKCKEARYDAIDVNGKIINGEFNEDGYGYSEYKIRVTKFNRNGLFDTVNYITSKNHIEKSIVFTYNELNLKLKEISLSNYGSADTTYYYYNSESKLIKEEWFIGNKYHGFRRNYYNSNGFLIADSTYDYPSILTNRNMYELDKKGNKTIESFYIGADKLSLKYYYDYDDQNRKIYQKSSSPDDGDENIQIVRYYYNNQNKVIKELTYSNDNILLDEAIISYDGNLNEIKRVTNYLKYNSKSIREYRYDYDNHGNWIKKISFSNGKPDYIEERDIYYY